MDTRTFMVVRRDQPGMSGRRAECRPEHLEWLATSPLPVRMAGPLLDPQSEKPVGSIFFVDARTMNAVRIWTQEDPFHKAGIFGATEIRPFSPSIGGFAAREETPES